MVWQEKVSTIAMVTNTMERYMKKCEVYWPDVLNEEKEVGPFIIKLTSQQVFADYTVRYLELEV
jgi:protein tyrosine phosphatase